MIKLNNSKSEKSPDKKILSIVHMLHPFVKQRIRVGENLGIFPRNMYQTNEIIDEVVLDVYEGGIQESNNIEELRMIMFEKVNHKMHNLFKTEEWHKYSISTKIILEEELKLLEENFTMDADNDLIMNEDLDDISYHQNDKQSTALPYDSQQESVQALLELMDNKHTDNWNDRNELRRVYYKLPLNSSNIVDLYILGKLSLHEIASILHMEVLEVKEIVNFVKETFKKQLE